ncbi:hypothetical protein K474DRAFT_733228 [Panus rudis PR-1116 ss-1]|nr:hypothetical protein K474DRAFT_733228 [Panus rudis PR-1116 ss-1]
MARADFAAVILTPSTKLSRRLARSWQGENRPTLIRLRTTIGYGSKQQGTYGDHGSRT